MQSPKFRFTFAYIKSNEEIINYIYKSSEFTKICRNIAGTKGKIHEDLKQDCLELILKKRYDLVPIHQSGGLNYFFAAIALKTFRSNAFNTVYRYKDKTYEVFKSENYEKAVTAKSVSDDTSMVLGRGEVFKFLYVDYVDEEERKHEQKKQEAQTYIIGKIENPNYTTDYEMYEAKLIEMYYRTASCAEISRLTGIPERTVYLDVQRLKKRLKSEYDKIANS